MEKINFSAWMKFEQLAQCEGRSFPGVYLIAQFDNLAPSSVNIASSDILYVGETTGQTLAKRLRQFSMSGFYGKTGHSGGWSFARDVLDFQLLDKPPENLYISLLPVDREPIESKAYIKYVERLVIWKFFQVNNKYPLCNTA